MSQVSAMLEALKDGKKSLEEVAAAFAKMEWAAGPKRPATYAELVAAEESDPEPMVEGSFDEVSAAYAKGWVDDGQYKVLAEAAARPAK